MATSAAVALLLWLHWAALLRDANPVYLLAAIFGAAAGAASTFAILVEGGGRAVLLIPREVKRLIKKGQKQRDERRREAYRRFGFEVDGVRVLPDTPEVQAFLESEPEEQQ